MTTGLSGDPGHRVARSFDVRQTMKLGSDYQPVESQFSPPSGYALVLDGRHRLGVIKGEDFYVVIQPIWRDTRAPDSAEKEAFPGNNILH